MTRGHRRPGAVAIGLVATLWAASVIPAAAQQPGEPRVAIIEDLSWKERARLVIDRDGLPGAFTQMAYRLPWGSEVYLAEVVPGVGQPAYVLHDAGDGAFSVNFYPMSAVKVLVAAAAVRAISDLGFTGDAIVRLGRNAGLRVADIYHDAISWSSNVAYDRLIQISGLDYINQQFIPDNGLESMNIGSTFSGLSIYRPPSYTLVEGFEALIPSLPSWIVELTAPKKAEIPARTATSSYRLNDTDLFDLIEVLRRVILQDEIPASEGFGLPASDAARLGGALCEAEPKNFESGVREVLGDDAVICNKPGWWKQLCIDQALIVDADTGRRFLLAATGACGSGIRSIAAPALRAGLNLTGTPLQPDAGVDMAVELTANEGILTASIATEADWALVWVDDGPPVTARSAGDHLVADLGEPDPGPHLLVAMGISYGVRIGYRSVGFEVSAG